MSRDLMKQVDFLDKPLLIAALNRARAIEKTIVSLQDIIYGQAPFVISGYEKEELQKRVKREPLSAMSYAQDLVKMYGNYVVVGDGMRESYSQINGQFRAAFPPNPKAESTPLVVEKLLNGIWSTSVSIHNEVFDVQAETLDALVPACRALMTYGPEIRFKDRFLEFATILNFVVTSTYTYKCSDLTEMPATTSFVGSEPLTFAYMMGASVTTTPLTHGIHKQDDDASVWGESVRNVRLAPGTRRKVTTSESGLKLTAQNLKVVDRQSDAGAPYNKRSTYSAHSGQLTEVPLRAEEGECDVSDLGIQEIESRLTTDSRQITPTDVDTGRSNISGTTATRPSLMRRKPSARDVSTSVTFENTYNAVFSPPQSVSSELLSSHTSSISEASASDGLSSLMHTDLFDVSWFTKRNEYITTLGSSRAPVVELFVDTESHKKVSYTQAELQSHILQVNTAGTRTLGKREYFKRMKLKSFAFHKEETRAGCAFFMGKNMYTASHIVDVTRNAGHDSMYIGETSVPIATDYFYSDRKHDMCVAKVRMQADSYILPRSRPIPELAEQFAVYFNYRSKPRLIVGVHYSSTTADGRLLFSVSSDSKYFFENARGLSGALLIDRNGKAAAMVSAISVGTNYTLTAENLVEIAPKMLYDNKLLSASITAPDVTSTTPVSTKALSWYGSPHTAVNSKLCRYVTNKSKNKVLGIATRIADSYIVTPQVSKAVLIECASDDYSYIGDTHFEESFQPCREMRGLLQVDANPDVTMDDLYFVRQAKIGERVCYVWPVLESSYFRLGNQYTMYKSLELQISSISGHEMILRGSLTHSAFSGSLVVAVSDNAVLGLAIRNTKYADQTAIMCYAGLSGAADDEIRITPAGRAVISRAVPSSSLSFNRKYTGK